MTKKINNNVKEVTKKNNKKIEAQKSLSELENTKNDLIKLIEEFEEKLGGIVYKLIISFLKNNLQDVNELIIGIEEDLLVKNLDESINKEYENFLNNYTPFFESLVNISKNYSNNYSIFRFVKNIKEEHYFNGNSFVKLLYYTIQFLTIEINLPREQPNIFESYVLNISKKFEDEEKENFINDKQLAIYEILNSKRKFILLKLDLLIPEKIDDIDITKLSNELDITTYKEVKDILIFYKKDNFDIKFDELSKLYIKDYNKVDKKSLDYYFLVKYYKDEIKDLSKLEELYNSYKKDYSENIKNIIFIGNNLLSLSVEYNKGLIDDKINILYQELDFKQKGKYKNYFTYLKYADYKIKLLNNYINNSNYNEVEKNLEEINKLKDKIVSIYESGSFFELNEDECFIINNNEILKDDLPKIYCPNLIKIEERYSKDVRVERLESKIEYSDFIINQNKIFNNQVEGYKKEIFEHFDKTRDKQIEILAVFSAIVLFVSGTIQLYTRLNDLESAIVLTLLFSSLIMIIISTVIKDKFKFINLLISIGLLILGFIFPYFSHYLGFENKSLNINIIEDRIEKIDSKIEQYKNISDFIIKKDK